MTVYEHKVKDKKQKEAKTELCGQTTFDGLPLVKNSTKYELNLKLFSQFSITSLDDLVRHNYFLNFVSYLSQLLIF